MKQRKIIHVDLDAFFSSVEQLDDPKLRGKPVVVGGQPDSRGVVAAASYESRKFGVKSAMSCAKAYRLCPKAIFVPPRLKRYKEVSEKIRKIFSEVTDIIEPLSLDEAFLDVTENKLNEPSAKKIAVYLKSRIKGSLGLTASAGVSSVKFIAKIASDINKPDGLTVIPPEKIDEFIGRLPVEKLWGVGPATHKKLKALNIIMASDLQEISKIDIIRHLGKQGLFLRELSFGRDNRTISSHRKSKSCGAETTFSKDIKDLDKMIEVLNRLVKRVTTSLVKKDKKGRTITLKVRYENFETVTRAKSTLVATNCDKLILQVLEKLLKENTLAGERAVRLLGVSISGFEEKSSDLRQLEFSL